MGSERESGLGWDDDIRGREHFLYWASAAPSASQSSSSVGALRGLPHNGSGSVFGFVQGYPQFDVGSGIQLDGSKVGGGSLDAIFSFLSDARPSC